MFSRPANARHEHQQRRLRQVEVGEQPVDDAEPEARRDEELASRASPARTRPSSSAADSSARRLVVPTATTLPPRARAASIAATVSGGNPVPLGVHPVLARGPRSRPAGTCPAPTCSVTNADAMPRRVERAEHRRRRSAARRSAPPTAPGMPRVDGLVARRVVGARPGARCRAAAAPRRGARGNREANRRRRAATGRTVRRAPRPSRARRPAGAACRRAAAGGSRGAGRAPRALRARARAGARPCRRSGAPRSRALITRVSLNTTRSPAREEPRQIGECEIRERASGDVQQPAAGAPCRRLLRDQLGRQRVVEVG